MSAYQSWEERKAEGVRIIAELRASLELEHGMAGHPKSNELWKLAWEYGHAYGAHEVRSYYDDMVELLK